MHKCRIAIIGAGAAGCFAAQRIHELCPGASVVIFEAQDRPLKKVAVTGGGRCNLTNSFQQVGDLREVYPRGNQLMKRLMYSWSQWDTMSWFEEHGVRLLTQDDECVFPQSQRAMEIVNVLKRGLDIRCAARVGLDEVQGYDAVVVTTGGSRNFSWLDACGVLITHSGVSGPCILRLSSYAARYLSDNSYRAPLVMNWLGGMSHDEVMEFLADMSVVHAQKLVCNTHPGQLTSRHWEYLVLRAGIGRDVRWNGVGRKQMNRLASVLVSDNYQITGRVPHKEEFVTAGGVSLRSVDAATLECKNRPGLFFAGEVLDVDGVTGGFNLQAAWTMADAVARAIATRFNNE